MLNTGALGDKDDKDEKKGDGEEEDPEIIEARKEAEERRKEKHRKMEEEREKMRHDIRERASKYKCYKIFESTYICNLLFVIL